MSVFIVMGLVSSGWDCIPGPSVPGSELWSVRGSVNYKWCVCVCVLVKINDLELPNIVLGKSWMLLKCVSCVPFTFLVACGYLIPGIQ